MKMNPVLVGVAALYAAAGLVLTFGPSEALSAMGGGAGPIETWAAQLAGAGFLGLAILNWAQRYAVVGGVFGRPLLLANLLFAMAGAGASVSAWRDARCTTALAAACVLGVVAVAFGLRLFRPPPAAA
jgi:hypothetical protein